MKWKLGEYGDLHSWGILGPSRWFQTGGIERWSLLVAILKLDQLQSNALQKAVCASPLRCLFAGTNGDVEANDIQFLPCMPPAVFDSLPLELP